METSKPWKSANTAWQKATGQWERGGFTFNFDDFGQKPYLILMAKTPGKVLFDDITLSQVTDTGNSEILNPDFETGLENWSVDKSAEVVPSGAGRAGKSIKLFSDKNWLHPIASQGNLTLKPGQRYRLSYSVRSAGVTDQNDSVFQRFRVYVTQAVPGGEKFSDSGKNWQDVEKNWQTKSLIFTAVENKESRASITCQLRSPGSIFFDNFKLEPIADADRDELLVLDITSPNYRNSSYCSDSVSYIKGRLTLNTDKADSLKLILLAPDGRDVIAEKYPARKNIDFTFSFPEETGEYTLAASACNAEGKTIAESKVKIYSRPQTAQEVVLRSDNVAMVNGHPFFPIGVWHRTQNRADLYSLASNGINTLCYYTIHGLTAKKLNLLHQYNIMGIGKIEPFFPVDKNDPERKKLEDAGDAYCKEVADHPALLAYILADEPLWGGAPLDRLVAASDFYRSQDPYHPILVNAAPRGSVEDLSAYSVICDMYGVDIYPVPDGCGHSGLEDQTIGCVGKYAARMAETVKNRKPVWMTLQGFAWKHYESPTKKDAIYPTYEQTRFMAFDSIVNGATGILYWGVDYIADPDYWKTLFRVTGELRNLSAIFVAETIQPSPVKVNSGAIRYIHKKVGDIEMLIAVNESDKKATAAFASSFDQTQLNVISENRNVPLRNGIFRDVFTPYSVHIYSTDSKIPRPLVAGPEGPAPEGEPEFLKKARLLNTAESYTGKAQWIWHSGLDEEGRQKVFIRKEFSLNQNIEKPFVYIAADDSAEVYVNGRKVCTHSGWSIMKGYPIKAGLKKGKNLIAIEAENIVGAAGVFAEIRLDVDRKIIIETDATWRSSLQQEKGWSLPEFDQTSWTTVKVIGPAKTPPWTHLLVTKQN